MNSRSCGNKNSCGSNSSDVMMVGLRLGYGLGGKNA